MRKESGNLNNIITNVFDKYKNIEDETASINLTKDSWSLKEIFGHLVDSAANNYQRFIRLQETKVLTFPAYNLNWITIVKYNTYPYQQIIELWKQYNLLICHIIINIDEKALDNSWEIDGKSLSLEFLVKDYIEHLKLHIDHLSERYEELQAAAENK